MTQIFKFWSQIWNQREKLYKNHFTSSRGVFFQNLTSKAALCQGKNGCAKRLHNFSLSSVFYVFYQVSKFVPCCERNLTTAIIME